MQIEMTSVPKYRSGDRLGDDVPLILPGTLFGVFDGATDAFGKTIDGVPTGRVAALTVARAAARLLDERSDRQGPADAIFDGLAAALRARIAGHDLPIPPSTTLALAIDCGATWRFLLLGDSGIRLNGTEVLQRTKIIDEVATSARVAVFEGLRSGAGIPAREMSPDAIEMAARRVIFRGLDLAVAENVITTGQVVKLLSDTVVAFQGRVSATSVERFLRDGISRQWRYANATGDDLCFDTMNGGTPLLGELIDVVRSKEEVTSIEMFTDGYSEPPAAVSVAAWEARQRQVELEDYHMTGAHAGVKGATAAQFFDDRTVIVVSGLVG